MDSIVLQLRALQLLTHRAHNECNGPQFLSDHKFFGKLYPSYEGFYDNMVERIIGLESEKLNLAKMNVDAAQMASVNANSKDCAVFYRTILKGEKDLCELIKKAMPKATDGTQNLLQAIADKSEQTQYKIKKRLSLV